MTTISAKVIRDSINKHGIRLTTLQLRYPLIIHAEFLTHRVFSRNSASNRAIPFEKILKEVEEDPFIPIYWGKNKPGMQANEEVNCESACKETWLSAIDDAIYAAKNLNKLGLHKQIVNRVLMPYQHINTIVTATDWDNFFELRDHEDAEPHIRKLAKEIKIALNNSNPDQYFDNTDLIDWQWHLPYITNDEMKRYGFNDPKLRKASVARCARVSYNNHDNSSPDVEKDILLADRLLKSKHLSPFEHQATVGLGRRYNNFNTWKSYRYILEV